MVQKFNFFRETFSFKNEEIPAGAMVSLFIPAIYTICHAPIFVAFPISVEPNSFVNIVTCLECLNHNPPFQNWDEVTSFLILQDQLKHLNGSISKKSLPVIFTIHDVDSLKLGVGTYKNERAIVGNFTIKTGYLRFFHKFKPFLTLFILFTKTFNKTIAAIQNSGYGTSDQVPFFVQVSKLSLENPIISQFHNDLFTSDELEPFFAPIMFFTNAHQSVRIALFCYFCPYNSDKLEEVSHSANSVDSNTRKRHGHGLVVKFSVTHFALSFPESVTVLGLSDTYTCFKNVGVPEMCVLFVVLNLVNVSSVKVIPSDEEWARSKWLLNLFPGESTLLGIPVEIVRTRGALVTIDEMSWKVIFCVRAHFINILDYSISSVSMPELWILVISVGAALTFTYKNWSRGLDIMWLFIGVGCQHDHGRIRHVLFAISLVACIYSAHFSSNSMLLGKFPTFRELFIRQGYRIWIPPGGKVLAKLFYATANPGMIKLLDEFMEGLKFTDGMFDGESKFSLTTAQLIAEIVEKKLGLWGYAFPELLRAFGKSLKYICQKYICRTRALNDDFHKVSDLHSFRHWGCISTKVGIVHSRLFQAGIYVRAKKSMDHPMQHTSSKLDMMNTDGFIRPDPMNLKSVIGISAMYIAAAQLIVLIVWLVRMVETIRSRSQILRASGLAEISLQSNTPVPAFKGEATAKENISSCGSLTSLSPEESQLISA